MRAAGRAMEIDQLRTFLAVHEHGSFSRAAEAVHLSQSTVSFQIKALETAVGSRLLDRRGGRVRPTDTGRLLRRYAQRIVSLREEALARTRAEEEGQAGRITIAASTIPAEYLLPPALARLRRTHPGVQVVVQVSDSRRAGLALLAQECDLALVGSRLRDRRLVCAPFAEDEVLLVGPSPNPFAPSGRLGPKQLARVPLVLREEGSGTREAVAAILARRDAAGGAAPAAVQVGSTEAAKRCVLAGLGLTFISRRAVADELAAGRLRAVAVPGTPVRRTFHAARLRAVTPSAAARAFWDVLVRKNR
jgi:DNA-binding transcriptional LysR family regulator